MQFIGPEAKFPAGLSSTASATEVAKRLKLRPGEQFWYNHSEEFVGGAYACEIGSVGYGHPVVDRGRM